MGHRFTLRAGLVAILASSILAATPALAASTPGDCQPRHDADRDHGRHHAPPRPAATPPRPAVRPVPVRPAARPAAPRRPVAISHFNDRHRGFARDYYVREFSRRCPPGLTRSGRSCVSRHSRAWVRGRPLPRSVVYYDDLPPALLLELGPPPAGHRYVRVAGDILMIAIGTGLVVDALQDIFQ
ncbi:MAG: RcnB family protein [Azoarcus sp.]|jgi:Ni/Co efflux regulator RcnB|nr:RcnB family protein [Azoarcus sp.]